MQLRQFNVCSWSLQPESPQDLAEKTHQCGCSGVQLALEPIRSGAWGLEHTRATLAAAGIRVVSAMLEPIGEDYSSLDSIRRTGGFAVDEHWAENTTRIRQCAAICEELDLSTVSFHAGFIADDIYDTDRAELLARINTAADLFGDSGVMIALETGQESAETMSNVHRQLDRESVGINFDPANMILYGMGDPIAALRSLSDHVTQLHIKDAKPSTQPGHWGTEVPVGEGDVDWTALFAIINAMPRTIPMIIEREAGQDRIKDVGTARTLLERFTSPKTTGGLTR